MAYKQTIIPVEWEGPFVPQCLTIEKSPKWYLHPHDNGDPIPVGSKRAYAAERKDACDGRLDKPLYDRGIYQIYGNHPLYGKDVLLYIGITGRRENSRRTFADRLGEQLDGWGQDITAIHVGRLGSVERPGNLSYEQLIRCAERLLIFEHAPAYNGKHISSLFADIGKDAISDALYRHVICVKNNHASHRRSLSPEVCSDYPDHFTRK